jgi:Glycosyl transferase family 2
MTFTRSSSDSEVEIEGLYPEQEQLLNEVETSTAIEIQSENCYSRDEHLLHGVTVTVVFPCLNEELAVGLCVERALETMRVAGLDGSVLVVDNGSTDNSARVAMDAGAQVILQREPGYGAALRSGIEAAQSEFVIMADADGTYELDAIPRLLLPLLYGEADMVLGQRLNDASAATMPWLHRYVGTPAITFLVKKATKNKMMIRDSQSGFRAFRREQILALNLSSTGMEFASEMLIRSSWADLRIREVDTKYAERIGDSKLSTFSDGLRHLRQILLLSPETGASIPGMLATGFAILLWIFAAQSTSGFGQVGSLSWVADVVAGILSILGPLVFCTGIVLRYRAETSGLRNAHVKMPVEVLIRRFLMWGASLIFIAALGLVALLINFHQPTGFISSSVAASLSSFVRSAFVVGIVLTVAPLLSPFLMTAPRTALPIADEEGEKATLRLARRLGEKVDSGDACLVCQRQGALREA